ncbi:MAG: DUF2157 domain-containing protein [Victivallaceae bacterium]|nr:DUF2157 domain-containing protein [Victivallaceae bacterium]
MSGKNYKFMEWLLKELPKLRENAVIDQTAEERLREHYQSQLNAAPSTQKYLVSVLAVFGACLICLGMILLIAFNWDMLPKSLRLGMAFVPLLSATVLGGFTIVKKKDNRWREASAVSVMAGVITLTALISQIYHLSGTMAEFMSLILAVTFPLFYIFRSYAFAALYCFGLFFLVNSNHQLLNLLYLVPLLPFLIWNLLRSDINSYAVMFSRWLSLSVALFVVISMNNDAVFGSIAFVTLFYVFGTFYRDHEAPVYYDRGIYLHHKPWLFCGWLGITLLLLFGWHTLPSRILTGDIFLPLILVLSSFLITGILAIRERSDEMAAGVLTMILFFLCIIYVDDRQLAGWLCHALLLGFGVFAVVRGIRARRMEIFNIGMLQISSLVIYRFFSADFDLFWRAMGFMAIGAIFVVANIVVNRASKKDNGGVK